MMRGKRMAKPLSWRSERIMLLKATSRTIFGSTMQAEALIFDRVFQEPLGHFGDFGVGQS